MYIRIVKQKNYIRLMMILAFINLLMCVVGSIEFFTSIPIYDAWSSVIFFARVKSGDYSAWIEHHNEHRIILTRLLFWFDFSWGNGSGKLLIITNYVLMLATYIIFYWYLSKRLSRKSDLASKISLATLIFMLLFSWVQRENIIWTFQSQFFLASLIPLLAFYCLYKSQVYNHGTVFFSFSCMLGTLALGNMGNGILVLPMLALLAIVLRMEKWRIALLALMGGIGGWLYFYGFQVPVTRDSLLSTLLSHPVELLHYLILYLGAPFFFMGGSRYNLLAESSGVFFLFIYGLSVYRAWYFAKSDSLGWALVVFILFVLGTAVGTAAGRLAFGVTQALASRYTTPVIQGWVALLIFWAPDIAKIMKMLKYSSLLGLLLVEILLLIPQFSAFEDQSGKLVTFRQVMLASVLKINDQELMQAVFASPEILFLLADAPSTNQLAFFNSLELQEVKSWKDKTDSSPSVNQCQVSVDLVESLKYDPDHLRLSGWIFSPYNRVTPKEVRILSEDRQVIGYALLGLLREDVQRLVAPEARFSGFKGYVAANYLGQKIILKDIDNECEVAVLLKSPSNVVKVIDRNQLARLNSKSIFSKSLISHNCFVINDEIGQRGSLRLEWLICKEKNANGQQGEFAEKITYQEALSVVNSANLQLTEVGRGEWRLPTENELSLLDRLQDLDFRNGIRGMDKFGSQYWTRSEANYYGYYAWDVLFLKSYEQWRDQYYHRKIILVRNQLG